MDRREKLTPITLDPDSIFPQPQRRHTDSNHSSKPSPHFPHIPPARPRLPSWHNVSGSMDYSNIAVVTAGARRGSIKTGKDNPFGVEQMTDEHTIDSLIDSHTRHSTGPEVSKRILELAAPPKRPVYTKDLDLVDTKVKLSKLHIKWPEVSGNPAERKSKSTSRARNTSPDTNSTDTSLQTRMKRDNKPTNNRPLSEYVKGLHERKVVGSAKSGKRCVSAEKPRVQTPKSQGFLNPSEFDLRLVREYNEEQQHLMTTVREGHGWKLEPHSILRSHMQEFAPWAANDIEAEDGVEKAVRFQ